MEIREEVMRRLNEIRSKVPGRFQHIVKNRADFREYESLTAGGVVLYVKFDRESSLFTCYCQADGEFDSAVFGRKGRHGLISISVKTGKTRQKGDIPKCVCVKQGEDFDGEIYCAVIARAVELVAQACDPGLAKWKQFYINVRYCVGIDAENLTRNSIVGLIGELLFMKDFLVKGRDELLDRVVDFWKGPLKAPKDYILPNCALEVKTSASNDPTFLRISNLRQLESNKERLVLAFCRLAMTGGADRESPGERVPLERLKRRLAKVVSTLKGHFQRDAHALKNFEQKLMILGVDEEDLRKSAPQDEGCEDGEIWRFYEVPLTSGAESVEFPRITTSSHSFPDGVVDVAYTIKLSALESFEVGYSAIAESIEIPFSKAVPAFLE